jgi:hypothetical protein
MYMKLSYKFVNCSQRTVLGSFGFYVNGKKIHSSEPVKNAVSGVINLLFTLQEQIQFPERKGMFERSLRRLVLRFCKFRSIYCKYTISDIVVRRTASRRRNKKCDGLGSKNKVVYFEEIRILPDVSIQCWQNSMTKGIMKNDSAGQR